MPSTLNRTGYLTLRQAAAWLGIGTDRAAALRLLRILRARERETGSKVLERTEGGHYRVTKCKLRQFCPEHWNRRNEVLGIVKERFKALDERMRRAKVERRALGARILQNSREIAALRR